MKKVALFLFISAVLAGCSSVPKPKVPNENNRIPVNQTLPVELQSEAL